ncbi:MAG: AAA family ATPase [Rhodoferax sp.]|nr:AAA family ATPase [Rhodoferax sp.]
MDAGAVAEVVITCGADIKPVPVRWLWQNWLARGKFHLLAGAPGQGKTTIAMCLAATVTTGVDWPDGAHCDAGNVLVWSGEDDYRDTLLPRLLAAGADRSRVHFIDGVRRGGVVQPFDPAIDTSKLQAAIRRIGDVRLIIIDPVSTAIAGDSHKNAEVRRGLQPIVDLAASIDAVLLGITHLSKAGQGGDPAQRVIGSVAFTAVARVVLVAAKVKGEDGEDRRILARGKSNLGPDDGGFEYSMKQVQAFPGIEATRIEWGQAVHGTARELLTDPAGEDGLDKSAVETAADFLRDVLDGGVTPFTSVKESADEAGISLPTIRRASKSIGVIKTKGEGGKWYWKLAKMPQKRVQGDQGDQGDQP